MSHEGALAQGRVRGILWMSDLSARAAACEHAVRWLATLGSAAGEDPAAVVVAHALDERTGRASDPGDGPQAAAAAHAAALAQVAALAGDLGSVGIDARAVVARGSPVEVARELVDQVGLDLCVAGRTGGSRLGRALLGSTARRLVRELPVPVMIVHDARLSVPRHILCPVDPGHTEAAAASAAGIRVAAALARATGARLDCVGIALDAGLVPQDRLEVGRQVEARVAAVLEGGLVGLDLGCRVVSAADVPTGIVQAAGRADLLVLGSAGRRGLPRLVLGSVAEDLVGRCPANTLVVH